ncbi:MAG: hypothetical protein ACYS0D_08790, partial [Planctomycetota bacterium]
MGKRSLPVSSEVNREIARASWRLPMEHFAYSSGTSGEIAVNPGSLARADLGVPCFAARRSM